MIGTEQRTRGLLFSGHVLPEPTIELISVTETHEPTRVVGRIGYPGDRKVRHARGTYTATLELVLSDGTVHQFEGAEAEAIALILATEIPK